MQNCITLRYRFCARAAAIVLAFGVLVASRPLAALPAQAAELDGVVMPSARDIGGEALRLNGVGLRTYSVFRVHIYVAGLYLPRPSSDADAILREDGTKLLEIHFVHDVSADKARQAWIDGFADNCVAPCHLPPKDVAHFLASVPDFRRGDQSTLLFGPHGVTIAVNDRPMGTVTDPTFARAILATFIGPFPPTEPFKRGLLGTQ